MSLRLSCAAKISFISFISAGQNKLLRRFCWRVVGLALMQDTPSKEIRLQLPLKEGEVSIAGVADAIQNVADGCWMFHNEYIW